MVYKITFLFILLTSIFFKCNACLNYYVIDSSGHKNIHDHYSPSSIYIHSKDDIKKLKYLEKQINIVPQTEKYKYISDYCAILIKLGRQKEAVTILEKLLSEKPNEYTINANLAVAYELDGNLDKALASLKKSITIDPDSHRESEWFHLRIVESAIQIRDKNLNLGSANILKIINDTLEEIGIQISYQLQERIPLSKSKNDLLSKVLEESADFYNANISLEWAIELYAIAIAYSSNEDKKTSLWNKITVARKKLIDFKNEGKEGNVSKYLFKANWQKSIIKQIAKWDSYKPFYYDKQIMTSF
jgi:tetratricopeptide (TPR) repeat protein